MRIKLTHDFFLTLCAICLATLCVLSIINPLLFEGQRAKREEVVKKRLIAIRSAEEKYKKETGFYTGEFKELVKRGFLADSVRIIPFSDGEEFEILVTTCISKSGKHIPLMEFGAQYYQYLNGLDENSISNLIEKASVAGSYPGLKIGDITKNNENAGNWE